MTFSSAKQQPIIQLLTRLCLEIAGVETSLQLMAGDNDFRPRIESFHDAVRALTSGADSERLSVERLTYDLQCLRYLAAKPLAVLTPQQSPGAGLMAIDKNLPAPKRAKVDRATTQQLGDLYRHYALLFAALLKPSADNDCRQRVEDINQQVEEINEIVHGDAPAATIAALTDEKLKRELLATLKQGDKKKLQSALKAKIARKDKESAAIEKANMDYALAQLAIYEESKDLLKKLATEGMNLAGKFVESSIAATKNQMSR